MASIAAALSLAPGPDPGLLDRIAPTPGRRDLRRWEASPAGLAWAGTGEPGLLAAPEAGYALAFDGRLDNRDELRDRLGRVAGTGHRRGVRPGRLPGLGRGRVRSANRRLRPRPVGRAAWPARLRPRRGRVAAPVLPPRPAAARLRLGHPPAPRRPRHPRRLSESAVADYLAGTAAPARGHLLRRGPAAAGRPLAGGGPGRPGLRPPVLGPGGRPPDRGEAGRLVRGRVPGPVLPGRPAASPRGPGRGSGCTSAGASTRPRSWRPPTTATGGSAWGWGRGRS